MSLRHRRSRTTHVFCTRLGTAGALYRLSVLVCPNADPHREVDTQQAMPEESATPDLVERSREMLEAANRGDFDAVISFFAPDAVWESWMGGDRFEGRAAIRERVEEWLGVFEDLEFKIEEILDLGRGVVFAVVRQDARPIGSAARVSTREAWVVVLERGMIVRRATFADIDEGRAAAERAVESREKGDA